MENSILTAVGVENDEVDSGGGGKVTGNLAKSNNSLIWMPFLTLSNADIQFARKELTWRSYITAEALPTTKRVEIIDKKEFTKAALDENVEAFVVHVTSLSLNSMPIHPAREAQIASLVIEEVQIPSEYSDFSDVFSEERASILPEATELNQHAIELQEGQQPPYGPIYSLGPVELETLKLTLKPTSLTASFGLQNHLLVLLSSLSGSQTAASAYEWITGVSITSRSRTGIYYLSSMNH